MQKWTCGSQCLMLALIISSVASVYATSRDWARVWWGRIRLFLSCVWKDVRNSSNFGIWLEVIMTFLSSEKSTAKINLWKYFHTPSSSTHLSIHSFIHPPTQSISIYLASIIFWKTCQVLSYKHGSNSGK